VLLQNAIYVNILDCWKYKPVVTANQENLCKNKADNDSAYWTIHQRTNL